MKAFSFRLEQVRRWRAAQVDIEKAKAAAASAALNGIRSQILDLEDRLRQQAAAVGAPGADGSSLSGWASFQIRTKANIGKLREAEKQAQADLAAQMKKLVEVNRQAQLIENLKAARKEAWDVEFGKELETFAAESFLGRLQSKRMGA